jgi:hypothetical protein
MKRKKPISKTSRSTLESLTHAKEQLSIATSQRVAAETAAKRADVVLVRAQEVEGSALATYKAARAAVLKAFPEVIQ